MRKAFNTFQFLETVFFLTLFLGFSQFVSSQNIRQGIRGKVRDEVTFKYLESVNLIIFGTNYGTSSKPDGSFEIAGIQ